MNTNIRKVPVEPWFELEDFMNLAKESRLEAQVMQELLKLWEEWQDKLSCLVLNNGGNSWLLVYLPEDVEITVDEAWNETPSRGYLLNVLAQYLCIAAISAILPQVADHGCAPAPAPNDNLCRAIQDAGLDYKMEFGVLNRRYAVLTQYPFSGGCEVCNMRKSCPKANGNKNFASVLLPGYERGRE